MDYTGIIIEESLNDKSVLRELKLLKTVVEPVTPKHQTPYLKQWTLDTVEIEEGQGEIVAEKLSHALDTKHSNWYADFKNDKWHFIIYREKVFKVDLENPSLYQNAREYGISIGIPAYQVDFAPEDQVWSR